MFWPYIVYIFVLNKTNPRLRTYGYLKIFCSVFYTSFPHFTLLLFRSVPFCETYPTYSQRKLWFTECVLDVQIRPVYTDSITYVIIIIIIIITSNDDLQPSTVVSE